MPLFIVETDDNVEERGIRWGDRANTWHGHDINWTPKRNDSPGQSPISGCTVRLIPIGSDRGTQEAVGC